MGYFFVYSTYLKTYPLYEYERSALINVLLRDEQGQ